MMQINITKFWDRKGNSCMQLDVCVICTGCKCQQQTSFLPVDGFLAVTYPGSRGTLGRVRELYTIIRWHPRGAVTDKAKGPCFPRSRQWWQKQCLTLITRGWMFTSNSVPVKTNPSVLCVLFLFRKKQSFFFNI